jgi:hypothetical protein
VAPNLERSSVPDLLPGADTLLLRRGLEADPAFSRNILQSSSVLLRVRREQTKRARRIVREDAWAADRQFLIERQSAAVTAPRRPPNVRPLGSAALKWAISCPAASFFIFVYFFCGPRYYLVFSSSFFLELPCMQLRLWATAVVWRSTIANLNRKETWNVEGDWWPGINLEMCELGSTPLHFRTPPRYSEPASSQDFKDGHLESHHRSRLRGYRVTSRQER